MRQGGRGHQRTNLALLEANDVSSVFTLEVINRVFQSMGLKSRVGFRKPASYLLDRKFYTGHVQKET
jgi:hypothetical protein